jgi:predicted dinucleotide-binding enzyme
MSVGIVGAGNMGGSIAAQLAKTGQGVTLSDRNRGKAAAAVTEIGGDRVRAGDVSEAVASDVVVLALWYPGTTDFARYHAAELGGKIVIDISNPLDDSWIRLQTDPSTELGRAARRTTTRKPDREGVQHDPRTGAGRGADR